MPAAASRRAPDRCEIVFTVGLALALYLVAGTLLQRLHLRWGVVLSQALFIAGPVLLGIRRFRLDIGTLLPLALPRALFLPASLAGLLALHHLLTVAGARLERLLPPPEAYSRLFIDLLAYHGPADFILLILVFAIVPAICEEILFRGFLLNGLLAAGGAPNRAILLQALVFALFHFDPWRLPQVLGLGLFLGFLAQRSRSLTPAVLAHAVNNGLSITLAAAERPDALLAPGARRWFVPAAALALALALLLLHRSSAGRARERML